MMVLVNGCMMSGMGNCENWMGGDEAFYMLSGPS